MNKALTIPLILLFSILATPTHASSLWLTNFESAQTTATAENKNILVLFTGSDWCSWCVRLEKEVFATGKFEDYARQNLILVKIDFPRSSPISTEQKNYNEKLARQYGIRGFPTVLIFNPKGQKIGQTGYQPGGPDAFLKQIPSTSTSSTTEESPEVKTEDYSSTFIITGLALLLILLGYITWQSIHSTTIDLPDPKKYSAEFLGSPEEFEIAQNHVLISGNKFSLVGSTYDPESLTLVLKSGGTIRFLPKNVS